ncbi:MAG: hypothetical protein ACAH83_18700 [Alphaproteobacteria bacterium]
MADARPKKPVDAPQDEGSGTPPPAANDSVKPLPAIKAVPAAPAAEMPQAEATPLPTPKNIFPAFNAKAVLAEVAEQSAFPRVEIPAGTEPVKEATPEPVKEPEKIEKGFPKLLRMVGLGDIVDAAKKPKHKKHYLSQAIFDKIGFGDIYKAAATPRQKTFQKIAGVSKAVGKKTADMIAGRFVSSSFRLIAITFVAGMIGGVTGWGSICLLALATGAASAIYTYGKEYIGDKLSGPKEERKKVKFFERKRVESAGKAFLTGTFNGALGIWLASLPVFQSVMKLLHDLIDGGVGQISKPFNEAAAPKFTGNAAPESILTKFSGVAGRAPPAPAEFVPSAWKMRPGPRPGFGF